MHSAILAVNTTALQFTIPVVNEKTN